MVLITGSGRGIGRALALGFASEGAKLVINALNEEHVLRVVKEVIALGSDAIPVVADVSTQEGVDYLFDSTLNHYGDLDILINNAGLNIVKSAIEMTEKDWDDITSVNLKATFMCSKSAASEFMIPKKRGRIINISSIGGITPFPYRAPYATSKAAVIMLTKELAIEWARFNVLVNAIAPGFFLTDMFLDRIKEGAINEKAIVRRIPMGRLGELSELVDTALFLSSDCSNYITGQTIAVDGGFTSSGWPEFY